MNNKRNIVVVLLLIFSLVLVTLGTTLAFFTYKGIGQTYSTITTGGITFHYKEINGKGRGISISDALPVADNSQAKSSDNYFDFKITSTVTDGVQIPYTVTARMSNDSDSIMGNIINIYLTEVNGNSETATALFSGDLVKYNSLDDYENRGSYTEKVIYTDTVNTASYEKNFRLRMWIDQNTNLNTGNGTSNYNNKTFSITVNVNATGHQTVANNGLTGFARVLVDAAGGQATVEGRNSTETDTMLADQDDDGTTYYYKGRYDNNFVDFAGQLWRVVRVNGDSSIRMIAYNPIGQENKALTDYTINTRNTLSNSYYFNDDASYAPYYYFRNQTKIIPLLETWYESNMNVQVPNGTSKYKDYIIENAKYCEAMKTVGDSTALQRAENTGYQNLTVFDNSTYEPSYLCIEDSEGHRYYEAPVAFLTLDELLMSGYQFVNSGADYHFLDNRAEFSDPATGLPTEYRTRDDSMFWTMTPAGAVNFGSIDYWKVDSNGIGHLNDNGGWYAYRPVINIKNDVEVTGTGTESDPYRIVME